MASISFDYDPRRVKRMLTLLQESAKNTGKIYKKRFTAALRMIQDPAKSNLRTIGSPYGRRYNTRSLTKYIRLRVYFNNKPSWQGGMVSIQDDRKKGSKSFLLRFFEQGAGVEGNPMGRYTRKGKYYRGAIQPTYFFDKAVKRHQEEAVRHIEGIVDDIIKSL